MQDMTDRADLLARTQGSNDLEKLPAASPDVQALLDRWARRDATEVDLLAAEQQILAGELGAGAGALDAPRAATPRPVGAIGPTLAVPHADLR